MAPPMAATTGQCLREQASDVRVVWRVKLWCAGTPTNPLRGNDGVMCAIALARLAQLQTVIQANPAPRRATLQPTCAVVHVVHQSGWLGTWTGKHDTAESSSIKKRRRAEGACVVAWCWREAARVPVRTYSTHTKASEQMLRRSTVLCPLAFTPWCGPWGQRSRRRLPTWVRGGRKLALQRVTAHLCHTCVTVHHHHVPTTPTTAVAVPSKAYFGVGLRSAEPRTASARQAPTFAAQCWHRVVHVHHVYAH